MFLRMISQEVIIQTHRQTDTKVNTEDTRLSGFQEFFLQPIIKNRSNTVLCFKCVISRPCLAKMWGSVTFTNLEGKITDFMNGEINEKHTSASLFVRVVLLWNNNNIIIWRISNSEFNREAISLCLDFRNSTYLIYLLFSWLQQTEYSTPILKWYVHVIATVK